MSSTQLCRKSILKPAGCGSFKRKGTAPKKIPIAKKATMEPRKEPVARGTNVLKEILFLQRTTHLLIPRASFAREVRKTAKEFTGKDGIEFRWKSLALQALQEAYEQFGTNFFEAVNLCALHRQRVTVNELDTQLVKRLWRI